MGFGKRSYQIYQVIDNNLVRPFAWQICTFCEHKRSFLQKIALEIAKTVKSATA